MKPSSTSPRGHRISALALAAAQLLVAMTAGLPVLHTAAQDAATARPGEPVTLNFSNAEIESVARTMAVVTGRDVVVDPRVKGTINLVTDRAVPPAAAFNQFAAALRLQGFAVVESEGLYKIVPEADAKLQSNTVTTSVGAAQRVGGNQIVTQVFKLNYESANNLLPVLRPLIAPNNTINVNPGNNTIVVTDYAENMRRLGRIIAALDVPNAADVEVIQLRHSIATDLVPLVQRLVDGSGGTGQPGAPAAAAVPGGADASFRTTLLAEPRSNAIIMRAANAARAQLVRTLIEKLDKPPVDTGNGASGNIYVVYLKNADAVRLATTLRAAMAADPRNNTNTGLSGAAGTAAGGTQAANQNLASQALNAGMQGGSSASPQSSAPLNNANQPSTGGQVQADPSTNSLIITASEPQYRQLSAVIERLDSRRAQVMVEALITEVNAEKVAKFGVQWQGLLGGNPNRYVGNSSNVLANIFSIGLPGSGGAGTIAPPPGLNIASAVSIGGQTLLGFLANFLETNSDGNTLATPNLMTLDNEEAKIVVGQNVPFVTGQYTNTGSTTNTVNPFQTIERKDVGLTLRVRPTINADNTVRLQIFQEVSSVDPTTTNNINGPTTNKRSVESSVVVDNGNVVALAGLLQDDYGNTADKVPLAGDIPVLGYLFKNETRSRKKVNLMIFLRPVVVRENYTSDVLTYDRYDALRSNQMRAQPESNVFLNNVPASPLLPPVAPPQPPASLPATDPKSSDRIQGTRLIPPPIVPMSGPLQTGPLKGALPPTADPSSGRELP